MAWHESAPKSLRRAAVCEPGDGWKAWKKHLRTRRRPLPLSELLDSRWPLAWCLPKTEPACRQLREIGRLATNGPAPGDNGQSLLASWLSTPAPQHLNLPAALSALAWCHALPQLARHIEPQTWWMALDRLGEMAAEPTGLDTSLPPLVWQLAAAELPGALAYQFPELEACRQLAAHGRQALVAGIEELLDSQGLPRAQQLDGLMPLVACWTRMAAMADKADADWPSSASRQFANLLRHVIRLSRVDGTLAFSGQPIDADVLSAAARLVGDARLKRLVSEWKAGLGRVPDRFEMAAPAKWSAKRTPAVHSEWSELAVLRRDWTPASPRLAVAYSGRNLVCEAAAGRHVLFSGPCQPQVRSGGRMLEPTSDWEEICWVSDEDGDYIELEITLDDAVKLQRQMYLARRDLFLFSADAVLAPSPMPLEYDASIALGDNIQVQAAEESREFWLAAKKPQSVVLPLALPEWRSDPRVGQLTFGAGRMRLVQSTPGGRGLFAPLWFDLNRARLGLPLTWRQLTVAENRQNQPADIAVGYRVQVGRQNWLVYRSLTGGANRTVLGHHLLTQFAIGQFTTDGQVLKLVEIE